MADITFRANPPLPASWRLGSYSVFSFATLDSTNSYAKRHIDLVPHGAVILARAQSSGRGRLDRAWVSPDEGNLYFSIVLKQGIFPETMANLTQVASVSLVEALELPGGDSPQIKWPNDILVDGKKLCGILAEAVFDRSSLKGLVLGIGINVNMKPESLSSIDRPATSLSACWKRELDPMASLEAFLEHFERDFATFRIDGFAPLAKRWEHNNHQMGKRVRVDSPTFVGEALAVGLNPDGSLLLRRDSGVEFDLVAGDADPLDIGITAGKENA